MATNEFYKRYCPKNPAAHVAWRKHVLERCVYDEEYRQEVWIACSRDPLYYFNLMHWLLEPRDAATWQQDTKWGETAKEIPFLTRDYQDRVVMRAVKDLGKRDICVLKSRETGATWMFIALAEWDWRFHDQTHIGMSSKDENSVDDPENPDSLFSKIKFIINRLPLWMRGTEGVDWYHRTKTHVIVNARNGSTISGFATGGNMGRGGRKLWWFMDELHSFPVGKDVEVMDSVQHVTRSRVYVSTPNKKRGQSGAFYDAVMDDTKDRLLIDIDWKDDAEKAAGLYTSHDGKLEKLDPKYKHPYAYKFILDGKMRSPYYDFECRRPNSSPASIAAELDKDFGGATSRLFSGDILQKAKGLTEDPVIRGKLQYDEDTLEPYFMKHASGNVELWCSLVNSEGALLVPEGHYSMGVDISRGTGSAYSAIVVIDKNTGHQVAEFSSNKIKPWEFAKLAVAMGKWFHHAYMVPEVNAGGGGTEFIREVLRASYPNLYYRESGHSDFRKKTNKPGYQNQDKGEKVLSNLEQAIAMDKCVIKSGRIVTECGQYFFKGGILVHAAEQGTSDDGSKGKGHGDSAIACALAWFGVEDIPAPKPEERPEEAKLGSFQWRRNQREQLRKMADQPSYWRDYV